MLSVFIYVFCFILSYIYIIINACWQDSYSQSKESILMPIFDPFRSPITLGKSSRQYLVFTQSWIIFADKLTLMCSCIGVHWWISLLNLSLLLELYPAWFGPLIWMVFEMRGKWQFTYCLWGAASRICSKQHAAFFWSSHKYQSSPL